MRQSRTFAVLAAGLAFAAASWPAVAGPPLLCFPYQIGDAKSLPWGKGNFDKDSGYDRSRVVEDALALLKTERSTLVRMETLRRAAVYIGSDTRKATELLAKISWIAMDADAAGKPSAEAWFNAGFLAATFRQSGAELGWRAGVAEGADGYAWIKRALEIQSDPAMEFGAALALFEHGDSYKAHLGRAVAGAKEGTDLAASIESNLAFGRKSLPELRKELGVGRSADASKPRSGG